MAQVRYGRIALRLWLCCACVCLAYGNKDNHSDHVTLDPTSRGRETTFSHSSPRKTPLPKPMTTDDAVDEINEPGTSSASGKGDRASDNSSSSSSGSSSSSSISSSSISSSSSFGAGGGGRFQGKGAGGGGGNGSGMKDASSKRNTSRGEGWGGGGGGMLVGGLGGVGLGDLVGAAGGRGGSGGEQMHPLLAKATTSLAGNLLLLFISVVIAGALFVMLLCFIHKWKENMGTARYPRVVYSMLRQSEDEPEDVLGEILINIGLADPEDARPLTPSSSETSESPQPSEQEMNISDFDGTKFTTIPLRADEAAKRLMAPEPEESDEELLQ